MNVEYLDLADYVFIASEVTGLDIETVLKITQLDLADSALHAPAAGFGDTDSAATADRIGALCERLHVRYGKTQYAYWQMRVIRSIGPSHGRTHCGPGGAAAAGPALAKPKMPVRANRTAMSARFIWVNLTEDDGLI